MGANTQRTQAHAVAGAARPHDVGTVMGSSNLAWWTMLQVATARLMQSKWFGKCESCGVVGFVTECSRVRSHNGLASAEVVAWQSYRSRWCSGEEGKTKGEEGNAE